MPTSTGPALAGPGSLLRCKRALNASRDAYWECHLPTGDVWHSPRWTKQLGACWPPALPCGTAPPELFHPDDLPAVEKALKGALKRAQGFSFEARARAADGQWRWHLGRGRVWRDADGQPEYLTGALTDIDDEKRARQALVLQQQALESLVRERTAGLETALALAEERRLEAERADAAKAAFLARMSHEVRTPLSGVLGVTELALRTPLSSEQCRYLESAHQSGQALLRLLDNVLDLSRIESGHVDLQEAPFDPASTVADVLRGLMPLCDQPEVRLRFDWEGDSPWVLGDESCLRQILTNLLGNAIKFTRAGHVTLQGLARRQGAGEVALKITVSDTGPGIPEHLRSAVFQPFVQGDNGLPPGQAGVGLGLAITSSLAQAMHADLQMHCPASGGTVFELGLVLPIADAAPACAAPPPAPAPGLVWLLYPDVPSGQWLAGRLRRQGWRTLVVPGVDAAVALARGDPEACPRVVVVPGTALHGVDSLRRLREVLPQTSMRLLVRPHWHEPELEALAGTLDIDTLVAPLTSDQLLHLGSGHDLPYQRHLVDGLPAQPPAAGPHAPAPVSPDSAGAPDRAPSGVLLVEDNPVNQLVSQEYLRTLGLEVRLAEGGEAAMAACLRQPPRLVLMDLEMPGMDGLQAARQLRALQRGGSWAGAPIVALTAHASASRRAACRAAGMDGVLTKPLSLTTLRKRLSRWLEV